MNSRLYTTLALLAVSIVFGQTADAEWANGDCNSDQRKPVQAYRLTTSMSFTFTENRGQWNERVRFRANAHGATMWFTHDGAVYQFTRTIPGEDVSCDDPVDRMGHLRDREADSVESIAIKASFVGANPNPEIVGVEMVEYKCNYFIGNDPDEWHTDVPNYSAIIYQDIYSGIDLKYYDNGRQMEYDFIVSPGADPERIAVRYEGVKSLSVNDAGELIVETGWGEVIEHKPLVYQVIDNRRELIECEYALITENSFSFHMPWGFDAELALVIDPAISYATYIGGESDDQGYYLGIDQEDNAYVVGSTNSPDFPVTDRALDTEYADSAGLYDVFVFKLSPGGDSIRYATFLGGNPFDRGMGIAVDGEGCAYVTGYTHSPDFPTWPNNVYDATMSLPGDAFVTKLSPEGDSLVYSTFLGGTFLDYGFAIGVDIAGCAYVCGNTHSHDFPRESAYDSTKNDGIAGASVVDGFVTKLSAAGDSLVYSTFLGGSSATSLEALFVDDENHAYVAGHTYSPDFPTFPDCAFDTSFNGDADAILAKLSPTGAELVYSTFLGGSGFDQIMTEALFVDDEGNAYFAGSTTSDTTEFPITSGAFNSHSSGPPGDGFAGKLDATGCGLMYCVWLGSSGAGVDAARDVQANSVGEAYICGVTQGLPLVHPFDSTIAAVTEAYLLKLSSAGDTLLFSTYIDGCGLYSLALNANEDVFIAGASSNSGLPITPDAYDTLPNTSGLQDVVILRIDKCSDPDWDWVCDSADNCPDDFNPDQADADGDNVGDACCCLPPTVGDVDQSGAVDITDISVLIDNQFLTLTPLDCPQEGDVDFSGTVDITDLSILIDNQFLTLTPLPPCP